MKDLLLFLCVAAAVATGWRLMKHLDAFIDRRVLPPDADDDPPEKP